VLLLVVEVFLVGAVVLARLSRLQHQMTASDARVEQVRRHLEQRHENVPQRFRWLDAEDIDGTHRTYVFVPVLMAAGAVLSVAALVIQKIASTTGRASAERHLAGRLFHLAAPPGGIRGPGPDGTVAALEDYPAVPPARPGRAAAKWVGTAAGAAVLVLLVAFLAETAQTRREQAPDSAATTVVFRVDVRWNQNTAVRGVAARELWESCRRSTRGLSEHAPLSSLGEGVYAGVIRPALREHDLLRLRGCLSDTGANRALADILGEGQAPPIR
jgi:hypothetical protein